MNDDTDNWIDQAKCRSEGVESRVFFDHGQEDLDSRIRTRLIEEAKKICKRCPVKVQCADYALEINVKHGIWGGMTERELGHHRRSRKN